MAARYQAALLHQATGETLTLFNDYLSLAYVKNVNGLGWFELELPGDFALGLERVFLDWRVVIWREIVDGRRYIDFTGFARDPERTYRDGRRGTKLSGPDQNEILDRPIVAYAAGSSQAKKNGAADDVMKELVDENLGSSATDSDRDFSDYLSVQADASAGTSIRIGCSRQNLMETLVKCAKMSQETIATAAFFGVVPLGDGYDLEFRTKVGQWGQDHRHPDGVDGAVVFSVERGNMNNVSQKIMTSQERNVVYALGEGQRANRKVIEVEDATRTAASVLNRREAVYDYSNAVEDDDLTEGANGRIEEHQPTETFAFDVESVTGCEFGVHWGLGDQVTVFDLNGQARDVHIVQVAVRVDDSGERVSIKVEEQP